MKLPIPTTDQLQHWVTYKLDGLTLIDAHVNPVIIIQKVAEEMAYQLSMSIVEKSYNLANEEETLP